MRVLSTREAAQFLGRSEMTLARWRRKKHGPTFVRIAGRPAYLLSALEAWLHERSEPTMQGAA